MTAPEVEITNATVKRKIATAQRRLHEAMDLLDGLECAELRLYLADAIFMRCLNNEGYYPIKAYIEGAYP